MTYFFAFIEAYSEWLAEWQGVWSSTKDGCIDILQSSPICTFCLNQTSYLPSQLLDICNANLKIYGRVMEI
jgi:hypothetical protein